MTTQTLPRQNAMDKTSDSQAIATRAETTIVRTPQEFRDRLQVWQREHYHVLSPFANFSALPAHYGLVPTMVKLDADPSPAGSGDVYQDNAFTRGEDVAIAKIGLSKIAQAAGMSITTVRTDPRTILNLWEVKATARWIGIDGTPQQVDGTEEYDLRDGSERIRGFTEKQVRAARAKGLRGCEARAINAAIRQYGIKQKYTKAELQKPFVIVRVVYLPDMADPTTRQQVNERALAGTTTLYPHALPAAAAPEVLDVIGDPTAGADVIDVRPSPPAQAQPSRVIEAVEHDLEVGVYTVRLDGGEVLTTSEALAARLIAAKKANQRVVLTVNAEAAELLEFTVAAAQTSAEAQTTLPADAVFIAAPIEKKNGNNARTKAPWTLYIVTFSTGEKASTFSETTHALLDEAYRHKLPLRIATSVNDKYPDQLNLDSVTLVDTKQPPLPGADGKY